MTKTGRSLLALVIAFGSLLAPVTVATSVAHETYFADSPSPECSSEKMLKRIKSRFKIQAREVHHNPDLRIEDIHRVHQTRYLPQDVHKSRPIARRYCKGHVHFSDGRERSIWYLIEGGAGFASYSDNVEFCISGMDDWNVYDAHCRVLR